MIQKKICMLGAYAVGKTSLVSRYVHSMFSDKYLTTIGVKIEKKTLAVDDRDVNLVLWDLAGEDEMMSVRMSYLRGAAGFFLVADLTRAATLKVALDLRTRAIEQVGNVPHMLLLNKDDLADQHEIADVDVAREIDGGLRVVRTSAKSGAGVEASFEELTRRLVS